MEHQKSSSTQSQGQSAVAGTSNEEPLPQIFKLDIDCFEELFEWLSLKNLLVLRRTSKRFKRLADYYIKEYYPGFKLGYGKVTIFGSNKNNFKSFRNLSPNLAKLIKQISFHVHRLNDDQINGIKEVLSQIEVLKMKQEQIEGDFYAKFLQFCPNLKKLSVFDIDGSEIMSKHNGWLHRKYPKLEHVEFDDSDFGGSGNVWEIPELKTFFILNPNIQIFSTTFDFLLENRHWMIGSKIQFDLLRIKGACYDAFGDEIGMDRVCDLVKTLYGQDFYKRLHFIGYKIHTKDWNEITELPAVQSLHLVHTYDPITLSHAMGSVKQLGFQFGCEVSEKFGENYLNIKRASVKHTKFDYILPFILLPSKIKEIRVDQLAEGLYFQNGIIDVVSLDRERAKLTGIGKQTIYVHEDIYLATKWAGMPTQSSLVQLKRIKSCGWQPLV